MREERRIRGHWLITRKQENGRAMQVSNVSSLHADSSFLVFLGTERQTCHTKVHDVLLVVNLSRAEEKTR